MCQERYVAESTYKLVGMVVVQESGSRNLVLWLSHTLKSNICESHLLPETPLALS